MDKLKLEKKEENEVLPIEKQKIKGKVKHVLLVLPALNERWVVERKFGFYVFPPKKLKNGDYIAGAKDIWLTSTSYVLDDIWWLCELQYHKFWSQIIYDKNALNGIKSFLHLAPLQKLYYKNDDPEILSMYKRMKKAVFQFLKRISRTKESEIHFMSDDKYSEILSETDLIPVSLLLCICTLYGNKYDETARAIVSHLFKYNNNLKLDKAILRTIQLFGSLRKKLKSSQNELRRNVRYSGDDNDILGAVNSYRQCILATLQFLTNAAINISKFLSIYEEGVELFIIFNFEFHIVRVYKKLLIPLHHEASILFSEFCDQRTSHWLNSMIDITRLELTKTFGICLEQTLKKLSITHLLHGAVQRYQELLTFSLKTEEFLRDLNNICNIQEMTERVKKHCPGNVNLTEIDGINESVSKILNKNKTDPAVHEHSSPTDNDEQKSASDYIGSRRASLDEVFDYVKECYDSEENNVDGVQNSFDNEYDVMSDGDLSTDQSEWSNDENSESEYECYMAASDEEYEEFQSTDDQSCTDYDAISSGHQNDISEISSKVSDINLNADISERTQLSRVELHSAVTHVKDLLPHLGDGFIALCLQFYKMDVSAVIQDVLEDSLPPSLKNIDFTLSTIPANIYQEMDDIHHADINVQNKTGMEPNLKVLRKSEYTSYNEMLNDKEALSNAKSIYERYRNIEEDDIYDDDVDEDYNEHGVAALEIDPEGFYEKMSVNNPNRRFMPEENICETDSENDNISEDQGNNKKPLDFCENPEITRARYANLRRVAEEKRHHRNNNNRKNSKKGNDKKTNETNFKEERPRIKESGSKEERRIGEKPYRDDRRHNDDRHEKKDRDHKYNRFQNEKTDHREQRPFKEAVPQNDGRRYDKERFYNRGTQHKEERYQNDVKLYNEPKPQYEQRRDKERQFNNRRPSQNMEISRGGHNHENEIRRNENGRHEEERHERPHRSDRQYKDERYSNDERNSKEPVRQYEQTQYKGERNFKDRIPRNTEMSHGERNHRENEILQQEKRLSGEGSLKGERHYEEERPYNRDRPYKEERYHNDERLYKKSTPQYDQRHHKEERQYNARRPQNTDMVRREQNHQNELPQNDNGRRWDDEHSKEERHYGEENPRNVSKEENKQNVSNDRHHKTVYKSRTANHNRKFLSDRKRKF